VVLVVLCVTVGVHEAVEKRRGEGKAVGTPVAMGETRASGDGDEDEVLRGTG